MKTIFKSTCLTVLAIACFSLTALADRAKDAVSTPSTNKYTAQHLVQNNSGTLDPAVPKPPQPLDGFARPEPPREVNSVIPEVHLEPERPRCSDFAYDGDQLRPVQRGAGYQCPPGYKCKTNGLAMSCEWKSGISHDAVMYADNPACSYELCHIDVPS